MLRRKAYDHLVDWKAREHSPLVIQGQRQVGKTFIVEVFARDNYEHYVKFTLSDEPEICKIFEESLDVERIIKGLKLYSDPSQFVPRSTLLFFDEIQECPMARSALKNFKMDGRYDVIVSGSLLGVTIPRKNTESGNQPMVPVGYEEPKFSDDFLVPIF